MKAYVYLNEHDGHFWGWRPEHRGSLELGGSVNIGEGRGLSDHDALELVFNFCNGGDPESDQWYVNLETGRDNRSLSVGDVVLLVDDAGQRPYACASAGWDKLPEGHLRVTEVPAAK